MRSADSGALCRLGLLLALLDLAAGRQLSVAAGTAASSTGSLRTQTRVDNSVLETAESTDWFALVEQKTRGVRANTLSFIRHTGPGQADVNTGRTVRQTLVASLIFACLWGPIALLCAFVYKHTIKPMQQRSEKVVETREGRWSSDIFECWRYEGRKGDIFIGCSALQCGLIRWADTIGMARLSVCGKMVTFWSALIALFVLILLDGVSGHAIVWVFIVGFCVYFRYLLRKKYNLPVGTHNCLEDFVCYCFCWPCVVAQEARHVEDMTQAMEFLKQTPY